MASWAILPRRWPSGPSPGFASRLLGSGLADDVAAETFLIAFDRRRRYDLSHASAMPWLYGIAERDRAVLLLVAWAQLSCEEAAQALGIPAATARSRLHRARRKTRAALAADPRSTDR